MTEIYKYVIGDVLISSAIITYLGPFNSNYRCVSNYLFRHYWLYRTVYPRLLDPGPGTKCVIRSLIGPPRVRTHFFTKKWVLTWSGPGPISVCWNQVDPGSDIRGFAVFEKLLFYCDFRKIFALRLMQRILNVNFLTRCSQVQLYYPC